jgi:hypothetical protein
MDSASAIQPCQTPATDDELSLFAKQTNFDEFECSTFSLRFFSLSHESSLLLLSEKLLNKEMLTEDERHALIFYRGIRRGVLASWREYLRKKANGEEVPSNLSEDLRGVNKIDWSVQRRLALIPLIK